MLVGKKSRGEALIFVRLEMIDDEYHRRCIWKRNS